MYTWEIKTFIYNKGNVITNREDFCKIINKVDNPQIISVDLVSNYKEDGKDVCVFKVADYDNDGFYVTTKI